MKVEIGGATLYLGDCLEVLRMLPECSVDAIVSDPPYGLSFMGKRWDYDVPAIEVWAECLRVLKPGGHLLAFAGTRTQHRMAVRIEDAGFEIRDMIAWVYGSGFPKSLDVSKAIDKARGAERVLTRPGVVQRGGLAEDWDTGSSDTRPRYDAPATAEAAKWQGWGTALKPALETVTFASKPYSAEQERDIIQSNLIRLEARLWLLSSASAAEKNSTSNPSEYGAACAIAQWSVAEITSTRAALCGQMDTSRFESATTTSLSIVSSWRRTLVASWNDGNTSTIETKSSTTIDWRTLKFSLSQITPSTIIKACSLPGGFSANASTAENHFNASLLLLQSILTLSATEPAISQAQHEHLGAGVKPNLDPCIIARKPLIGTVAENVLAHGTGALNIDGCRVKYADDLDKASATPQGRCTSGNIVGGGVEAARSEFNRPEQKGRWPANLIHDGSEGVINLFPVTTSGSRNTGVYKIAGGEGRYGDFGAGEMPAIEGSTGSAVRFFYCAKASKSDRGDGNVHPTVKPTDLMRYLCRLVTPPDGLVLDPFMGSGSTGKAAILDGFRFSGVEREAQYFDIACKRIESAVLQRVQSQQVVEPVQASLL